MSLALHCLGVTAYLACIGVHTVRKVKKKKKDVTDGVETEGGLQNVWEGGEGLCIYVTVSKFFCIEHIASERKKEYRVYLGCCVPCSDLIVLAPGCVRRLQDQRA